MRRKQSIAAIILSVSFLLSACVPNIKVFGKNNEPNVFPVASYDIWITTPGDWEQQDADNLDLQCLDAKQNLYLSAYGYWDIDLPEDLSAPEELFHQQNLLILDLRKNVQEIESLSTANDTDKTVYSVLFSAERDGSKNYYDFYMIDFKHTEQKLWILFTGIPSTIESNRNIIRDIVSNIKDHDPSASTESADNLPVL